ncbi:MAG TPA: tail-specific protease, partial [Candidatus Didemnitutus sp.]|nr:tail-specific protease [Candidatus Didemnitutus sp.]
MISRVRSLFLLLALTVSVAFGAPDRNYTTTPLMASETRTLVQMLEYYHYNKDAVHASDYNQLVTDFMDAWDPQRLFFTAQDEQALRKQYGPKLETDLGYLGNIDAAFSIFRLYEQRVQTRTSWIFDQLGHDFNFTTKDVYTPDRSKSPRTTTAAEADDLWDKRLRYEMLPFLLDGKTLDEAKSTVRKRHERMLKNIADVDAT